MTPTPSHYQVNEDQSNRSLLRIYAYYRFVLAGLIFSLFVSGLGTDILGSQQPQLFYYTALGYGILNLLTLFLFGHQQPLPKVSQTFMLLVVDVLVISYMMHISGGIQSGLGFLLLTSVAAGSLFLTGQLALLLAASASLCVILSSIARLQEPAATNSVFQSGLLGILIFITALFFQLLTRRLRAAQQDAEQKSRSAAQLQQLNQHIIGRMRTGILVVNHRGIIQLINDAALQLLGGPSHNGQLAAGRSLKNSAELHGQFEQWLQHPWLRNAPFREAASHCEIQANFTSLQSDEQGLTLIFLEDTRTLAQHAQQIKQSSLSRLTGSIAHEIRNPLGAISHASQLLEEDPALGQQVRLIQIIKKQSDRVNQLVENVMQLSRQQTPQLKKMVLNDWLSRAVKEYRDNLSTHCEIEIEERDTTLAQFDSSHLTQILSNLLDNALRYSVQETQRAWARIRVGIDIVSGSPFLEIEDRGPGVPETDRDDIFEPFFTTSHQGSGLGLYVCRELCQLNFATLSYHPDKTGHGCFRIGFAHPNRLLPGQQP